MQIGFAKVDITPKVPCDIVGYGGDDGIRTATSVLDPLYGKRVTVGELDLYVYDTLVIPENYGNVVSATHTHSGSRFDENWIWQLVCEDLVEDTAQMFLAQTTCDLNINRRRMTWRGIKMRPNPHAFRDNTLTIVKFVRDNNPPIYLINYACHATMWHGNSISADWPGRIKLDGEVIFLQGFSGNLIPDNRVGRRFKKSAITEADMDAAGEQVARSVREAEHCLRPCRGIFRILNLVP